MNYDLLAEWVSEQGSGSLLSFRQAHDWLLSSAHGNDQTVTANHTAGTMAVLAHIEIDWVRSRWCAAPPVLTILPFAGGRSLLTGARTRALLGALDEETSEIATMNVMSAPYAQPQAPSAIYLVSESESDIEQLAIRLGISYEFSVADRLSRLLPSLTSNGTASPGGPLARGFQVDKLRVDGLEWLAVESVETPGLYRYNLYGRPDFRYVDLAGRSFAVDKATGTYLELSRNRHRVLAFREDGVNGTLIVPVRAPLPTLQARAAALCSGLAPTYDRRTLAMHFVNVPSSIAERIASSLEQTPLRRDTRAVMAFSGPTGPALPTLPRRVGR
jgi:hypothetical protein